MTGQLPPVELPHPGGGRDWAALGVSALVHGGLLLAIFLHFSRQSPATRPDSSNPVEEARPVPEVRMVYLPPAPKPPPPAPSRPVPRPQVERGPEQLPTPEAAGPAPAPAPAAAAVRATATAPARPAPPPDRPEAPTEVAVAPTMESEALRLFGPQRVAPENEGPAPVKRWGATLREDRANDCRPREQAPRPAGAPVELGVVAGRVFGEGSRLPLGGAFLQILGTRYSTFADDNGYYRLQFDRSLVDECRTQYVQISKDGYLSQRRILSLGPRTSNDIPMERR